MELEGLLQALRAAGAQSITVTLRPLEGPEIDSVRPTHSDPPIDPPRPPEANAEATARVQALIDQLRQSDEQLADTIFPER
jgi:hypothetical protein